MTGHYGISISVMAQIIFVVVFGYHFSIWPHFAARHEGLADESSFVPASVHLLMD